MQTVALMAPLQVVVLHEAIEVTLNLLGRGVRGGAAGDAEALVEQRAIHAFDEAVGARRPDLGGAMVDVLQGEQQLVGMLLGTATVFPAIVGEDRAYDDPEGLGEGEDAIVEQIARGGRHLGGVDLGEGERAEDVDDDLDVDLADALEGTPVEGVLVEQLTRPRGFDMAAAEVHAVALEELELLG